VLKGLIVRHDDLFRLGLSVEVDWHSDRVGELPEKVERYSSAAGG